ncbi:MAG: hypothetical protein NTX50_26990 [Candidatus Sumerlaeota bacterium]|nr:hypothetical protein [Candidatus Sumerlaeota bacterium]
MCETDQTGAKNAYARLKQELEIKEDNLRCGLATYPEDNLAPLHFMQTVYQRLRDTRAKTSMVVKSQYLMRAVDEALNETIEKKEG